MEQGRFEEIVITTLERLREDISGVKADITNVRSDVAEDISNLKSDIAEDISNLKSDIANVKLDIANVKSDVAEDISNLKSDITEEISGVKSDVAWIKGKLEGRAETRHVVLTTISIVVAIGAVVVAILK